MSPSYVTKGCAVTHFPFFSKYIQRSAEPTRKNFLKKNNQKNSKARARSLFVSRSLSHGEHVVIEGISNALTKLFEEDHFRIITMLMMYSAANQTKLKRGL